MTLAYSPKSCIHKIMLIYFESFCFSNRNVSVAEMTKNYAQFLPFGLDMSECAVMCICVPILEKQTDRF